MSHEPRLLKHYRESVKPELRKKFNFSNDLRTPRITKVVINMGIGLGASDIKVLESGMKDLEALSGQKPAITRARKSIAGFKLREGLPIGCKVTLRKQRMYEFLDRFLNVAAPRIRDFRGFPVSSFDGRGSYTLGLDDQTIFPEVETDKIQRTQGMHITIVTNAPNDAEAEHLLRLMGMPFRERPAAAERPQTSGQ